VTRPDPARMALRAALAYAARQARAAGIPAEAIAADLFTLAGTFAESADPAELDAAARDAAAGRAAADGHLAEITPDGAGFLVTCPHGCNLGASAHVRRRAEADRRVQLHTVSTTPLGRGFRIVPAAEIDAEVAADVHRLTHPGRITPDEH
jgi:hypothetical protein